MAPDTPNHPPLAAAPERRIYTVAELNRSVRGLLEGALPLIWVEGEVSNLARPSSGHLYFSLKDAAAQVRCAMFRTRNRRLGFEPSNGQQVLVRARVSLYEPRGDYQLIVEHVEEAGEGALRRAFELLKHRLADEGLFDPGRKRPVPPHPQRIGVITSPTGAAIRDVLTTLARRSPATEVLIYPTAVQGRLAAAEIARMIDLASRRRECDVLILARGGGSLEDLWSFNEEAVARAIARCEIPLVSGIGHETDFTIADFVADVRAPTPSIAAELVTSDQKEVAIGFARVARRLTLLMSQRMQSQARHLDSLRQRLLRQQPGQRLRQQAQRMDELEQRMLRAVKARGAHLQMRLDALRAQLYRHHPGPRIREYGHRVQLYSQHMHQTMHQVLDMRRHTLLALGRALDAVSPLATLTRGYSVLTRIDNGRLITSAGDIGPDERLKATLAHGSLVCTVIDRQSDR